MKSVLMVVLLVFAGIAGLATFVGTGVYDVSAGAPHSKPVAWLLESVRKRSIERRAASIEVPLLEDSKWLIEGGPDYAEMCAGCHRQPGKNASELSTGLNPQPPDFTRQSTTSPAEMFWTIKHGIKMTGMPAWGATHDDQRMWAMVAFIRRLPDLTPAQYQILTARGRSEAHAHAVDHAEHSEGNSDAN